MHERMKVRHKISRTLLSVDVFTQANLISLKASGRGKAEKARFTWKLCKKRTTQQKDPKSAEGRKEIQEVHSSINKA